MCSVILATVLPVASLVPQNPVWVAFTDQTATRLAAAPAVGAADPEEKDLCTGDVDGDGDTDLIVVRKYPFTVSGPRANTLFLNQNGVMTDATAAYAPQFLVPSESRDAALADLNGDGWLDHVVANAFGDPPDLYLNAGSGPGGQWLGLVPANWLTPALPGSPNFMGVGVGDFSGDGLPDLYFVDYFGSLEDRIWQNLGGALFQDVTATNLGAYANSGHSMAAWIRDMDQDSHCDLVKCDGGAVAIYWNDATGHFTSSTVFSSGTGTALAAYDVAVGELDNDGDLDLYFVQDGQDQYRINPGGLAAHTPTAWVGHIFSSLESPFTGGFNANPHFADIDGDGDLDVGVSDVDPDIPGFTRRFSLLRNNFPQFTPTLLSSPYSPTPQNFNVLGTYDHAFLDINEDGWLDLWIAYGGGVAGGYTGGHKIFIQRPRARVTVVGSGCSGTSGAPAIGASGLPTLGNASFAVTLSNAPPSVLAVHYLCITGTNIPVGLCTVYANLFTGLLTAGEFVTDSAGTAAYPLPIPATPSVEGVVLWEQWVVLDPNGALPFAGGVALTAGLKIEVGI